VSQALETAKEAGFDESPEGQARRWNMELAAATQEISRWHSSGDKVVARFRDERENKDAGETRWNLFTSSVQTRRDMMYGKTPQVSVGRRFADPSDDPARVAGETIERALNSDIERDGDGYRTALRHALCDRQLPGLGMARARYVSKFEDVAAKPPVLNEQTGAELAPEVPATSKKTFEDIETDWIYWKDFRWAAGTKVWPPRWAGHSVEMSRKQLVKRFGEKVGQDVPLNSKSNASDGKKGANPWARADVWEIWSKEDGKVYWVVEGHRAVLDVQDDPYGLDGFYPWPEPMLANTTTDTLVPRPDYALVQNLYEEIDTVSTRISLIEDAIRVVCLYDKAAAPELAGLLAGKGNKMIPATNFQRLAEKGGLKGVLDWFPIEMLVNAVLALRDYRRELIDAAYQVSGDSDIMRGQATDPRETATAQGLKAKYGSVRMQARQDEFARFASDLQKIRGELMCKLFDPETILERANARFMPKEDQALLPQAMEVLKSRLRDYRIEVKPEAVALSDFAALKQESIEVLTGIAGYFSAVGPMLQDPSMRVQCFEILRWALSRIRGASSIEGVIDQAIAQAEKAMQQAAMQPPPKDPKVLAAEMKIQGEQMKAQAEMAKVDKELQADMVRTQLSMQETEAKERAQATWNIREAAQKQMVQNALKPPEAPKPTGRRMP
jgi:hypothetical protein